MLKRIKFWPKAISILNNEEGSVIIAAIMVLVLLTIVGIASTNTSNTEIKIATHELIYQRNFYAAEAATLEALDKMENEPDPQTAGFEWLWQDGDTFDDTETPYKSDLWEKNMPTKPADASISPAYAEYTRYVVVHEGIPAGGGSLLTGKGAIHDYTIYGRSSSDERGSSTVEIGYKKAF
jgi:hypothetical protein